MRHPYTFIMLVALALAAPWASAAQNSTPRGGDQQTRASALRGYGSIAFPDSFTSHVDNPYFPLAPGTDSHLPRPHGGNGRDDAGLRHRPDKSILGVRCGVVSGPCGGPWRAAPRIARLLRPGPRPDRLVVRPDAQQIEGGKVVGTAGSWAAGRAAPSRASSSPCPGRDHGRLPRGYAAGMAARTGSVSELPPPRPCRRPNSEVVS